MSRALRQICNDIIDTICERGSADLVRDVAAQLPMIVIGDMLGVLPEDRRDVLQWSEDMLGTQGVGDEDLVEKQMLAAIGYHEYATKVIAQRRVQPADDLISILLNAEIDGERLSEEDVIGETLLILIGGDETTRHVIAGGLEQLLRHPEHWESVRADRGRVLQTVEEMLRWVSPIKNMNRTLTQDYDFGGAHLSAGDQALLLYESANYDDTHFPNASVFDPDRTPKRPPRLRCRLALLPGGQPCPARAARAAGRRPGPGAGPRSGLRRTAGTPPQQLHQRYREDARRVLAVRAIGRRPARTGLILTGTSRRPGGGRHS